VLATVVSAVCGRPGFVPDAYLDELVGDELGHPGADPAVLAAELRRAGIWERAGGGYRVLDAEAVRVCADRVRELREQDARLAGLAGLAGLADRADRADRACSVPTTGAAARPGSGTWRPGVADLGAGKLGVDVLAKPVEGHRLLDSHGDRRQVVEQPTRRTLQLQ
jgi:hypothetical protein